MHALTWGYQGATGKVYPHKLRESGFEEKKFGVGDTVGCGLDLTKGLGNGSIYFTLNGKCLGKSTSFSAKLGSRC